MGGWCLAWLFFFPVRLVFGAREKGRPPGPCGLVYTHGVWVVYLLCLLPTSRVSGGDKSSYPVAVQPGRVAEERNSDGPGAFSLPLTLSAALKKRKEKKTKKNSLSLRAQANKHFANAREVLIKSQAGQSK